MGRPFVIAPIEGREPTARISTQFSKCRKDLRPDAAKTWLEFYAIGQGSGQLEDDATECRGFATHAS
jgi:hypothetical protein